MLAVCMVPPPVFAQVAPDSGASTKDEREAQVGTNRAGSSKRQKENVLEPRNGRARLRPFYDISFHSLSDTSSVNLSDYLIDQRFWERRPTLVVVTPLSPNVLQPDEGYAEALTETLLRQIAADLGVREVHDKVSQTIGFLRKLSKQSRRTAESETDRGERQPVEQAIAQQPKTGKPAEVINPPAEEADVRGLRTVQLVLLPDTRPIWNGMSLFDRAAVVDKSLNEYLKKVPSKRQRLLEYLEPDQFRFSAFPSKEAGSQMMDSLGLRRPELHILIVDRNGEVVGTWTKFTFDAKQISAAYRRFSKDVEKNGD
jgi:hypothetical protein